MTAISEYRPDMGIELPGCPNPVMDGALVRAIRSFLIGSETWTHLSPTLVDFDGAVIDITTLTPPTDIPADSEAFKIKRLQRVSDGCDISFKTEQQMQDDVDIDWRATTGTGPTYFVNDSPTSSTVYPIPSTAVLAEIRAWYVLTLNSAATTFPDFLDQHYREPILNGAIANAMKIPGKDWTNLQQSAAYTGAFNLGVVLAKSKGQASYGQPRRSMGYGGIP